MKKLFITLLMVSMFALSMAPVVTLAAGNLEGDINSQLEPVANVYGGSSGVDKYSLAETISESIQILLGFLGIIFIVLIIYSGFIWMTSAGSEEKIGKAKKIFSASIVGVAIILAAYLITIFVIEGLLEATNIS